MIPESENYYSANEDLFGLDIPISAKFILILLADKKEIDWTNKQIAKSFNIGISSVVSGIKLLEKDGYIEVVYKRSKRIITYIDKG